MSIILQKQLETQDSRGKGGKDEGGGGVANLKEKNQTLRTVVVSLEEVDLVSAPDPELKPCVLPEEEEEGRAG